MSSPSPTDLNPTSTPTLLPSPAEIVSKLSSKVVDAKTLEVITKLAFGNDAFKTAVSQSPLIHMMFDHASKNPNPQMLTLYSKALRSCVVNCKASRKLCNQVNVPDLIVKAMVENKGKGELCTEGITTLCAVCMNDEVNTEQLKDAMSDNKGIEGLCEGEGRDKEDLMKKCQFLKALVES